MDLRNSTNEEIYKRLIELTKDKNQWEIMVPYVGNLLTNSSDRIKEKATQIGRASCRERV